MRREHGQVCWSYVVESEPLFAGSGSNLSYATLTKQQVLSLEPSDCLNTFQQVMMA